jgi:hypothetical protein
VEATSGKSIAANVLEMERRACWQWKRWGWGVDVQSGGQPTLCQEATDALDAEGCAPVAQTRTKVLNN